LGMSAFASFIKSNHLILHSIVAEATVRIEIIQNTIYGPLLVDGLISRMPTQAAIVSINPAPTPILINNLIKYTLIVIYISLPL